MTQYTQHPLSAAFPALSAAEYQALKDSITDLGVQNAITIYDGQVLDGWNRYSAAIELGMECPERELDAWIDPRAFVLAQNKARRHLTVAQMAMAAVSVYEWRGAGRPSANSALSAELKQSEIAEQAGVSVRSLRQADSVKNDAVPAVMDAVVVGEIGLAKASAIAKLPLEQQAKAIHKPMREIAPAAAQPPASDAHGTALDMADHRGIDVAPSQAQEPPPEYTALEAAQDTISDLQAALAIASMGDAPEADRQRAQELIAELQAEVKSLAAQLRAANVTRDALLHENAEVKKQLAAQRRQIDQLNKKLADQAA